MKSSDWILPVISILLSILVIILILTPDKELKDLRRFKANIQANTIIELRDLKFLDNDFIISNDDYIVIIKRHKYITINN